MAVSRGSCVRFERLIRPGVSTVWNARPDDLVEVCPPWELKGSDIGPNVCLSRGIRSNEAPHTNVVINDIEVMLLPGPKAI